MAIYKDLRKLLPWHKDPKERWMKREFPGKIKYIVVHTTGSANQDPFKTNEYHITPSPDNRVCVKGAPRLAYHDYISKLSGEYLVYRCNEYTDKTWHAGLLNMKSIGVVMAYRGQDSAPEPALYDTMVDHVARLCVLMKLPASNVKGHREVPWFLRKLGMGGKLYVTECPGIHVDCDRMRESIASRVLELRDQIPTCQYISEDGKQYTDVAWVLV